MPRLVARTEFANAVSQVAREHGIEPSVVLDSIKLAVLAAFRRDAKEKKQLLEDEENYLAEIDKKTGEARMFLKRGSKKEDITPPGFGRIAALTAKQVILQKIREAEKEAVIKEYEKQVGTLVTGTILRLRDQNVIVDIGKTQAIMPPEEKAKGEKYRPNLRLILYLKEVKKEEERGAQIIVSRKDKGLIEGLLRREVPEVANGSVEIKAIAREPGSRLKIAVFSSRPGVDPVGSCVGQKGVRVQAIINELNGEKIDIIQYNKDLEKFIAAALSPAKNPEVKIDKKKKEAEATVSEDQLSVAIGKDGQNVRLAGKLTGYQINIRGKTQLRAKKSKPKTTKTTKISKTNKRK